MTDPWARPADEVPPHPPVPQPPPPPQPEPTAESTPEPEPRSKLKRFFRDPLSIVLVVVIVAALVVAGVIGTELVARRIADSTVTRVTSCGPRPVVLQYLSDNYNNITVTTGGERIREAEGMKAEIVINDVRVTNNPAAPGTVGALDAKITWSADGIKRTIQNAIPLIGSFVNGVTTNPSDGTIELQGMLGSIVTKPEVRNNELTLTVEALTGLGFVLPRETVQPALDAFLKQMTENYPLGIKADSVEVTDSGVIAKFFTRNATMPASTGQNSDPCFAGL